MISAQDLRSTFIPFHQWEGIGGPYTFMDNLRRELDRRGILLCPSFRDCRQMLFPISYDLESLRWGKARGMQFIVRLDGIYYPEKHGDDYRRRNQLIEQIYRDYADLVIFQSDYCRQQCFELFGEKPSSAFRIIFNGADFELFFPNEQVRKLPNTIKFITTGNFRDRAMMEPLIEALDHLKTKSSFSLQVVGPVQEDLQGFLDRDYVDYRGTKSVTQTAALLRQADIFLYSHLNPPCPNSVIEAISSGLPVVGFDSGSMSELLPFSRDLLAAAGNRTFQRYGDFDADKLREKIELAVNEYPEFKTCAQQHAKDYSFIHCADQYLEAIGEVAQQSNSDVDSAANGGSGRLSRFVTKMTKRLR